MQTADKRKSGTLHEIKENTDIEIDEDYDIEQLAKDELIKRTTADLSGHKLARLVEAILNAQGFITYNSPPGKDRGVDILAGSGLLGLEEPRLRVQVIWFCNWDRHFKSIKG